MTFFETIRVENFKAFNLEYHQERLDRTIYDNFGLKSTILLNNLIKPPSSNLYRCRVIYSRTSLKVEYIPYRQREFKSFKIVESDIEYSYKSTNRDSLNSLQEDGFDDIIITKNTIIRDTSIANIALL